jgi:hypothetical protein
MSPQLKSFFFIVTSVVYASNSFASNASNAHLRFFQTNPSPMQGFRRGLEPERIVGMTKQDGEIMYLVKWYV